MLSNRIIPALLIEDEDLIKTECFKNPIYLGDVLNAVKIYNEKQADELVIFDISKSKKKSEPNYDLIDDICTQSRMPICYGGGIKTYDIALKILKLGVEKISLSSTLKNDKEIISKIINHAGGQSLVITLNVTKIQNTYFHFYSDEIDKIYSLKEMLNYLNSFDIGELIIYDKDRDGTYKGYDLDLIEFVKSNSNLRFTILGGAVDRSDFTRAINICPYIGCAAGNMFVFKGSKNSVLINYTNFRK